MIYLQAANRRLFALLLPYMLLAVITGGLHHHVSTFAGSAAASVLPDFPSGPSVAAAELSHDDSDCLACQWLLQSSACNPSPAPAQDASPAAAATRPLVSSLTSNCLPVPQGRSPPLT
jgi:hypothetical protein